MNKKKLEARLVSGFNARGDVNWKMHGGTWVMLERINEDKTNGRRHHVYRIVKSIPQFDAGKDEHEIQDLHVDLSDSWIEVDALKSFADCTYPMDIAIAATEYYSASNFGNDIPEYVTSDELEQRLVDAGVFAYTEEATLINYFDVWGNQKDGWEVNNLCKEGTVTIPYSATHTEIVKALKEFGFLAKHVRSNMLTFEDLHDLGIEIRHRKTDKPICRLEYEVQS